MGPPNTAKQGKTQNDKSTLFCPPTGGGVFRVGGGGGATGRKGVCGEFGGRGLNIFLGGRNSHQGSKHCEAVNLHWSSLKFACASEKKVSEIPGKQASTISRQIVHQISHSISHGIFLICGGRFFVDSFAYRSRVRISPQILHPDVAFWQKNCWEQ